jgi:ketosteroid isomerase-like protein
LPDPRELLHGAYREFNARQIDAVLARMHPDVVWPNGMEGGFVYGVQGVRDYWTRQWAILSPKVEPVSIAQDSEGRWVVEVHQVVHDHAGNLLLDTTVHHAYRIEDGQIVRMDIE